MKNKRKFYAVRKGRKVGVFFSWDECKKQVHGYSGAEYKSFDNHADAQRFLDGGVKLVRKVNELEGLVAFVDGSYNDETVEAGYGCVFIKNGEVIGELSSSIVLKKFKNSRNIEGELEATTEAIHWAVEHGYKKITIVYDYSGIEKMDYRRVESEKRVNERLCGRNESIRNAYRN